MAYLPSRGLTSLVSHLVSNVVSQLISRFVFLLVSLCFSVSSVATKQAKPNKNSREVVPGIFAGISQFLSLLFHVFDLVLKSTSWIHQLFGVYGGVIFLRNQKRGTARCWRVCFDITNGWHLLAYVCIILTNAWFSPSYCKPISPNHWGCHPQNICMPKVSNWSAKPSAQRLHISARPRWLLLHSRYLSAFWHEMEVRLGRCSCLESLLGFFQARWTSICWPVPVRIQLVRCLMLACSYSHQWKTCCIVRPLQQGVVPNVRPHCPCALLVLVLPTTGMAFWPNPSHPNPFYHDVWWPRSSSALGGAGPVQIESGTTNFAVMLLGYPTKMVRLRWLSNRCDSRQLHWGLTVWIDHWITARSSGTGWPGFGGWVCWIETAWLLNRKVRLHQLQQWRPL